MFTWFRILFKLCSWDRDRYSVSDWVHIAHHISHGTVFICICTKRARLPHLSESYIILLNSRIYFIHIIVSRASNNYTIKQFVMVFLFFNICVQWNCESSQMVYILCMCLVLERKRNIHGKWTHTTCSVSTAHSTEKNLSKMEREKTATATATQNHSLFTHTLTHTH